MATHDSTRTTVLSPERSAKPRALTLRPHEARRLAEVGEVLVVRTVDAPQYGPNSGKAIREIVPTIKSGLWDARYEFDNPRFVSCPLGPVGSMLWGREAHRIIEDPGADPAEVYRTVEETDEYFNHETRYYVVDYKANGVNRLMDRMGESEWRSAVVMPRSASRFPRLRHESCEVKRADSLTWDELAATGMPALPDAIVGSFPGPAEYVEAASVDPAAGPIMPPSGPWVWCSLVRKVDAEVADV